MPRGLTTYPKLIFVRIESFCLNSSLGEKISQFFSSSFLLLNSTSTLKFKSCLGVNSWSQKSELRWHGMSKRRIYIICNLDDDDDEDDDEDAFWLYSEWKIFIFKNVSFWTFFCTLLKNQNHIFLVKYEFNTIAWTHWEVTPSFTSFKHEYFVEELTQRKPTALHSCPDLLKTPVPIWTLKLSSVGPGQCLFGKQLRISWCCWCGSGYRHCL